MRRRAFTLLEVLVALVLLGVGVLGALAARSGALDAARRADASRRARLDARDTHERKAARRDAVPRDTLRRDAAPGRGGLSFVELLVALVLTGVVLASAVATHGPAARAEARAAAQHAVATRAADAADLLVADLREWWAPRLLGDTAIEGTRVVGGGSTCAPGTLPDVPSGVAPGAPDLAWRHPPRAGDVWWAWQGTTWTPHRPPHVTRTRCPDGRAAWAAEGTTIGAAGASAVPLPWTVVRVMRASRWVAYRDADGTWQLGQRDAVTEGAPAAARLRWEGVQPVAGPFDALALALEPTDTGMLLRVRAHVAGVRAEVARVVHVRNP